MLRKGKKFSKSAPCSAFTGLLVRTSGTFSRKKRLPKLKKAVENAGVNVYKLPQSQKMLTFRAEKCVTQRGVLQCTDNQPMRYLLQKEPTLSAVLTDAPRCFGRYSTLCELTQQQASAETLVGVLKCYRKGRKLSRKFLTRFFCCLNNLSIFPIFSYHFGEIWNASGPLTARPLQTRPRT